MGTEIEVEAEMTEARPTDDGFWEVWQGDRRVIEMTFVSRRMAEGWIKNAHPNTGRV